MTDRDRNFIEKFNELHQELSNCRDELAMIHLQIGKSKQSNGLVSKHLENREKELEEKITELEEQLKNLNSDETKN